MYGLRGDRPLREISDHFMMNVEQTELQFPFAHLSEHGYTLPRQAHVRTSTDSHLYVHDERLEVANQTSPSTHHMQFLCDILLVAYSGSRKDNHSGAVHAV